MAMSESELEKRSDKLTDSPRGLADPDLEALNISQDYRRAKRNSLIWSALTILAIVGQPTTAAGANADQTVVSIFQLGMGFTQLQIFIVCLIASVFMFLGFLRSEGMLRLQNTKMMRQKKVSDYGLILEALSADVHNAGLDIENSRAQAHEAAQRLENEIKPFFNAMENLRGRVSQAQSELEDNYFFETIEGQGPQPKGEKVRTAIDRIKSRLSGIAEEIERPPAIPENLSGGTIAEIKASTNQFEERAKAIAEVAEAFSMLDGAIGAGQRRWHWVHDKLPVYGLFSASIIWGAVWLFC